MNKNHFKNMINTNSLYNSATADTAMGIKDFHRLTKPKDTSLKCLIEGHPSKNRIGVDTSVLIIKHLKSSANAINCIHSKPLLPVNTLGKFCCDIVCPMIQNGFLVFMVFDGASHPLKKSSEHRRQIGKGLRRNHS